MRCVIVLLLACVPLASQTSPNIWMQVNPNYFGPRLQSVQPSHARLVALAKAMLIKELSPNSPSADNKECDLSTPAGLLRGLSFEEIPVAPRHNVLLLEMQGPCAWGGTGGGGDMWLIRFDGTVPVILASPNKDFVGWLYSIQPATSHGYRDIVLGWHLSAGDYPLTYFRFDGKSYTAIGRAEDITGEITPKKQ